MALSQIKIPSFSKFGTDTTNEVDLEPQDITEIVDVNLFESKRAEKTKLRLEFLDPDEIPYDADAMAFGEALQFDSDINPLEELKKQLESKPKEPEKIEKAKLPISRPHKPGFFMGFTKGDEATKILNPEVQETEATINKEITPKQSARATLFQRRKNRSKGVKKSQFCPMCGKPNCICGYMKKI